MTIPWNTIGRMLAALLQVLPVAMARDLIDSIIDRAEKACQGTDKQEFVMATCSWVRSALSVPDEPGEDQANPV